MDQPPVASYIPAPYEHAVRVADVATPLRRETLAFLMELAGLGVYVVESWSYRGSFRTSRYHLIKPGGEAEILQGARLNMLHEIFELGWITILGGIMGSKGHGYWKLNTAGHAALLYCPGVATPNQAA